MRKRVEAAIGVLVDKLDGQGWRLLITRRLDGAIYGGYWEFPGGKIEPGERAQECLVREFAEEVGLPIRVGGKLPILEHEYEHAHVRLHPFFCTRIEGEPRNLHVAEHRWVRPEELTDYRFLPANTGLIRVIQETLRTSGASCAADL